MRVLVFLAFIGSICALQYPLEYHYHYEGRVATGIPSIRPQVAAVGIKAKLILQLKEENLAIAQLQEIEFGEYNEDLQCVQLRQPVPFTYQPMPEPHKQLLEQPFAVYFKESSGHVMDVHESDVEFITNIRKSVVEILRIEPIVANLGGIKRDRLSKISPHDSAPLAFTAEEESIFGRCSIEYTLTPLPPSYAPNEKNFVAKNLIKDEQSKSSPRSSTTNLPKLEEEYYRLVRAINFDKCHDLVIQQHAGGVNMSEAGSSLFRAVQSRSSVGTYIIKGKPGAFRIELAMVEGDVVVNPFGFKTERLQSITNQTLVLEMATPIQTKLILPRNVKPVASWFFEIASPFKPPQPEHHKEWVNYYDKNDKYYPVYTLALIGANFSEQQLKEIEDILLYFLDNAVTELSAEPLLPASNRPSLRMTKTSTATTRLYVSSKIIRYLPINSVRDVFSQVFSQNDYHSQLKQELLIDVAAASGAPAPVKVLLEMMKRNEISHHRIASIFFTIPNNLFAPTLIPELLEYVKSLDIESNPLLTSSALINFASLAERACINRWKFNYSLPFAIFGNENCDPAIITKDFLPHLVEKAKAAPKSYQRVIYLQAINNLGSEDIIDALRPFIYGSVDSDPLVRTVAIYGLSHLRLPNSQRERVFDTLMTIVDNLEERADIRQAAFSTLINWHPDAAWWQRMARSTWREPSRSLAAYITFIVQSLAKATEPHLKHQSRIAAFVLPLLKPFSPSLRSSYGRIYSRFDPVSKIGFKYDFSMTESPTDWAPSEIYTSLRENFGDLFIHLFEVSIASENVGKVMPELIRIFGRSSASFNAKDPSHRNRFSSKSLAVDPQKVKANFFLRAFENLYQMVPINADVISKVAGRDAETIIRRLLAGVRTNATKYINPLNVEFFLPTEIGLPLTGEVSMPTVNWGDADVRLDAPELRNPSLPDLFRQSNLSLLSKSNYKYASKLIVTLTATAPWNQKAFLAGVENYHELNLPFYANISWARTDEVKNISLNLSPYTHQTFPIYHQHNVPFTMVRSYIPNKDMKTDYKVIAVEKDRRPALEVRHTFDPRYTGLSSALNFSGDAPYPFTTAYFLDYLWKPTQIGKLLASPVAKQWQYSLTLDPKSEARNVTLALSFVRTWKADVKPDPSPIPDFSAYDDPRQRLDKIKQIARAKIYAVNAQLFFNATNFKRYDLVLALGREAEIPHPPQPRKYRIVTAVLMSQIKDVVDAPKALCSDTHATTPNIEDLASLQEAVKAHPVEELSSYLTWGKSCRSSKIANVKGTMRLSDEREALVSDELVKICNYDQRDPVVELQTAAVYDIGSLEVDFAKERIPKRLVNASYSLQQFVEGALFSHGSYDNLHSGAPNKIRVDARRPLSSKKYTFHVETPQKYSIFSEIHVPYLATQIVPLTGLPITHDILTDSIFISTNIVHPCVIKRDSVETWDAAHFTYNLVPGTESCWAIALRDRRDDPQFLVRVRVNPGGLQEAQVETGSGRVHVEITQEKAFINGDEMDPGRNRTFVKDESGQHNIMVVYRLKHGFRVEYIGFFDVVTVANNDIQIVPTVHIKGSVRGLCGDNDASPKYDETGPNNCLYTNGTLFAYAWTTTEGDSCDTGKVEEVHNDVKVYQRDCPQRPPVLQMSAIYEGKSDDDCYETVYPVLPEKIVVCASYDAVTVCKPPCHPISSKKHLVKTGCWPKSKVPPDVAAGEERGFNYEPPHEHAPAPGRAFVTEATKCTKD